MRLLGYSLENLGKENELRALNPQLKFWLKDKKYSLCVRACSIVCDSLWSYDCSPPGSSVHGDSPGKNTGVDCHILQGIFPTQGSNQHLLCLLHWPPLVPPGKPEISYSRLRFLKTKPKSNSVEFQSSRISFIKVKAMMERSRTLKLEETYRHSQCSWEPWVPRFCQVFHASKRNSISYV